MPEPRSYIVRIHHQGYRSLAGIVEDVLTGKKVAFRNVQELASALRAHIVSTGRRFKSTST